MTAGPDLEALLWALLGKVLLPLWLLAGACDYLAHARTRLPQTSGVHESALHLLQTATVGAPVLLLLFLRVNGLVLVLMAACVVVHALASWRDVAWATGRRYIPPFEQYLHSFLDVLPLAALALVAVLHWPAVLAAAGAAAPPGTPPPWSLHWRDPPFPPGQLALVLGACLLFGVLPGLLEFAAAWRRRRAPAR